MIKKCTGLCGLELKLNNYNFYWIKKTNKWSGQCKKCSGKGIISHIIIENGIEYQICTGECKRKLELNVENFEITKANYRRKCKKCVSGQRKQFREENKKILAVKSAQAYQENRNKRREQQKEYSSKLENKRKRNERCKKNIKEKLKNDPVFKIMRNIFRLVQYMLKKCAGNKNGKSTKQQLPFTYEELKNYIENQFKLVGNEWMNWENHGVYDIKTWNNNDPSTWTWNLDHIIPQSLLKFNSLDDSNFYECWKLENLRPYSSKQNILDGNRRNE